MQTNLMPVNPKIELIETAGFADYALLDCGGGRKLERFGKVVVDRPEAQALWRPLLSSEKWDSADAVFSASGEDNAKGKWRFNNPVPDSWNVGIDNVTVQCRMQGLWHLGLFPEQLPHWLWLRDRLGKATERRPRVLNLFAYTGAASLIAAAAGAEVTHVDASRKAIAWAKDNQAASGLEDAKVRWIVDDAAKFTAREVRRGKSYDAILVDPPKFGRGPSGEIWDLFQSLPPLLVDCSKLLAPGSSALILTVYAIRASSLAFDQVCRDLLSERRGTFDCGELAIRAETGRLLPTSLYVRWMGHD